MGEDNNNKEKEASSSTASSQQNDNNTNTNIGGSRQIQIFPMYDTQESVVDENTLIKDVGELRELVKQAVQKENELLKVKKNSEEQKDNNEKDYPIAYSFTDPFIIKEEEYNNSYEIGNFTFPILKSNEDCVVRKETKIQLDPNQEYYLPKFISLLEKKLKKIKILDIEKINQKSKTYSKYNLKIQVKGHDIINYITSDKVIEIKRKDLLSLKSKLFNFEPENEEIKYPFFDSDLIINRKESNEEDQDSLMVLLDKGNLKNLLTNYYNIYNELDSVNDKLEFKELIKFSKKLKENEKNSQLDLDYVIDEYDKILKKYFEKLKDSISKDPNYIRNTEFNKLDQVLQAKIKNYTDEYNQLYRNVNSNDDLYSIKYKNSELDQFMDDMINKRKTEKNETTRETEPEQRENSKEEAGDPEKSEQENSIGTLAQEVLKKTQIEEKLQKLRKEINDQIEQQIPISDSGKDNSNILDNLLKKIDLINEDLTKTAKDTEYAYKELNIAEVKEAAEELQEVINKKDSKNYDEKLANYIEKLKELEETLEVIKQIKKEPRNDTELESDIADQESAISGGKRNRYKHSFKSRKRKGGKKVKNAHSMRKGKRRGTKGSRKR